MSPALGGGTTRGVFLTCFLHWCPPGAQEFHCDKVRHPLVWWKTSTYCAVVWAKDNTAHTNIVLFLLRRPCTGAQYAREEHKVSSVARLFFKNKKGVTTHRRNIKESATFFYFYDDHRSRKLCSSSAFKDKRVCRHFNKNLSKALHNR